MPLNLTLALRNLFHDRLRFIATTIGIVFSVVLVMVQMGLYQGFGRMVTTVIDHTSADLWVMRHGTKCFEDPSLLSHSKQAGAAATAGVAEVIPLVIGFSGWILPSGEITPVFVVGSDLQILKPWNLIEGSLNDLTAPFTVSVDKSYFRDLGIKKIDDVAEINGTKIRVAAVNRRIRSFTTLPYVFTKRETALALLGASAREASYTLVRAAPDADVEEVRQELAKRLPDAEVLLRGEFRKRSLNYWLFQTGAGAALIAGALLGLIVGVVIVAQTLYSSTKDQTGKHRCTNIETHAHHPHPTVHNQQSEYCWRRNHQPNPQRSKEKRENEQNK